MARQGRGRPAKPNHLKVLAGTEERYINRDEAIPSEAHPSDTLVPPVTLSDGAMDVWRRLAPDLHDKGVLTPWDTDVFALYCENVATWHECKALLGGEYTARGAAGGVIKSPYWQIMRDAQADILRIASRFGLTPSDRASLKVEKADKHIAAGGERLLS